LQLAAEESNELKTNLKVEKSLHTINQIGVTTAPTLPAYSASLLELE